MNLRSEPVDPVAWGAARIALMAMRASIHPSMPLSSDAYALARDRTNVLGVDDMVPMLVAVSKPLVCRATVSKGTVIIHLDRPRHHTVEGLAWWAAEHTLERRSRDARESPAPDLRRMVEARGLRWEEAQALCFTLRDEKTLLLPVASVAEWDRDYERVLGGGWLDSVDNEVAADWPAYREARSTGAACVLRL